MTAEKKKRLACGKAEKSCAPDDLSSLAVISSKTGGRAGPVGTTKDLRFRRNRDARKKHREDRLGAKTGQATAQAVGHQHGTRGWAAGSTRPGAWPNLSRTEWSVWPVA